MACAGSFRISIHAPRGGSDIKLLKLKSLTKHFNPRSPRGERHILELGPFVVCIFQSTLPAGGATDRKTKSVEFVKISIHAPRGGSDLL